MRARRLAFFAVVALGAVAAAAIYARGIGSGDAEEGAPDRSGGEQLRRAVTLHTVFDADLENTATDVWSALQARTEERMRLVGEVDGGPVRRGSVAVRFEVRPGDNNVAGSGTGERAQLFLPDDSTRAGEGVEQWWAWSTYFPAYFDSPGGGWNVFTGFHHSGTTGQVPIQFAVTDKTSITLRVLGGNLDTPVRRDFTLAQLQRGKWYDFVFHVKWSSTGTGFVEVWIDGNRVVPLTLTPTLYPGQSVYLKQGYYRMAYDKTTVIYHDGTRRLAPLDAASASRDEVTETVLR